MAARQLPDEIEARKQSILVQEDDVPLTPCQLLLHELATGIVASSDDENAIHGDLSHERS
jgi:hypothetical protein